MKLLAMTVLCVDKYPELNIETVGGNSINIAARWKKLGESEVSVLGAVGIDTLGNKVIKYLESSGIEMSHVYQFEGSTAHNHFYKSADDELFHENWWVGGVFENFVLSDEDWRFVKNFDLICIPYFNSNFKETINRFAGKKEICTDFLNTRDLQLVKNTLPYINLAFISGTEEVASQLTDISKSIEKPIIITLGSMGSIALIKGESYFEEAIQVENKVDSIGCGDSYQAAFIHSWYKEKDIQRAMKEGAKSASQILQKIGGI